MLDSSRLREPAPWATWSSAASTALEDAQSAAAARRTRASATPTRDGSRRSPVATPRPKGRFFRGSLEVRMRGAVVPLGQRRPLARLALARRRSAARSTAVEGAGLDLLGDEGRRAVPRRFPRTTQATWASRSIGQSTECPERARGPAWRNRADPGRAAPSCLRTRPHYFACGTRPASRPGRTDRLTLIER